MAEVGLAEAIQTLRNSKISRDGRILHHNFPLTAEKLRGVIETAVLQAGGTALRTIVAGGRQACDPHEPGHGVLRAREPIIMDVFPRSQKTGYYGDISRTVIKGRASEVHRRMYDTVLRSQELAFKKVRHGVAACELHAAVLNFFESSGFPTGPRQGRMTGFFHGLGHGLGLEIHESPRVNMSSLEVLQAGHVLTLEPGLYYPELGGVRLEDVVYLNHKCAHNLTRFEKTLEIL
jgi:Xaa-Pro aminopeptidase